MKKVMLPVTMAVCLGLPVLAVPAAAQNNAYERALLLVPDGSAKGGIVYGNESHWYITRLAPGHSYVITITQGDDSYTLTSGSYINNFIATQLYNEQANLLTGARQLDWWNPATRLTNALTGNIGSNRYSYTNATGAATSIFIQLWPMDTSNAGDWVAYKISVMDTTVSCTWFYTSNDYESFAEVHNSSEMWVSFTAQHYSSPSTSGAASNPVGSPITFNLAPYGTTLVTAKAMAGVTPGTRGGIKIIHDGPSEAIKANVTTINHTGIGLTHSFNTGCAQAFTVPAAR